MRSNKEGGRYLSGQEGLSGGDVLGFLSALVVAGYLVYAADTGFQRGARTAMNEPEFPQGGYTEYKPVAEKFRMVYEGQQEPKCPGDIEKAVLIIPLFFSDFDS
jgi:hypothetical protein